jgi:hypothetical protein
VSSYFISYSRKDSGFVKKLYASLKDAGVDAWLDTEEIRSGEDWADAIQRGLDECEAMILVISPDSMASEEVAKEWKFFRTSAKKKIYPIRVKDTKIHYQLNSLNYIDFVDCDYKLAFEALLDELSVQRDNAPIEEVSEIPVNSPH